jgi:O-antigen/teichoic acid export membrane protein
MEYQRIFKDALHLFAGQAGTVIISFINLMILTRALTTDQMGQYSIFLMIVNLALIIGLNWSDASIVRHGREEFVNRRKINQSFWARMYLFLPVMIFFVIVFFVFSSQITSYIGVGPELIYTVILMFVLSAILNFISYIYQSIDKMKKSAYVIFSQKLFYLICLALVFFNIMKADLTLVLVLLNISFLATVILNLFIFDFSKVFPYTFNKNYLKKIWSYSWPQLIGFPGLYIINYIDIVVIKKYMTLHDVGTYSVAYNGFMNICIFIGIIHTIFLPLLVEYKTKKKYDQIKKYFDKIPLFTGIWIVLTIIGLLLSGHVIPLIFSQKYVASVPSFNVLLFASIFYFISICLLPIVNAFDFIFYSQIFNIVRAAINITGDLILVPKIGIIGAAYSTAAAYFIGMILTVILIMIKKKKIFGEVDKYGKKRPV